MIAYPDMQDEDADIPLPVAKRPDIAEIIKAYSGRLRGFIRKRVDNREDQEDILQEVFYQLARADELLKPIDQMAGWLFTVARNRITDLYRKQRPEPLPVFDEDDEGLSDLLDLLTDDSQNPETEYLRSLVMDELQNALEALPDAQREVFELTEFEGMPYKAIEEMTGEPVNTLISRKRYAVLYLRERLRVLYEELIEF